MTIAYRGHEAVLTGTVGVEEAEALLEWLQTEPAGVVDLAACTHLHLANLQVLMAAHPVIRAWPADGGLAAWMHAALAPEGRGASTEVQGVGVAV
jgi:hypothetical protein